MLDRAWLPFNRDGPSLDCDRPHLLCFPFAGGGASTYAPWTRMKSSALDVLPVQLPGREHRIGDTPFCEMERLLDALMATLVTPLAKPVVLFGHSLGALIAARLAQRMQAQGRPPLRLCVSGFPPPHYPRRLTNLHRLPQDEMLQSLSRLNGLRPEVLAVPELVELIVPTLYADLALEENDAPADRGPVSCPISLFSGVDDPLLGGKAVEAWNEGSVSEVVLHQFEGDHFFLLPRMPEILTRIENDLARIALAAV